MNSKDQFEELVIEVDKIEGISNKIKYIIDFKLDLENRLSYLKSYDVKPENLDLDWEEDYFDKKLDMLQKAYEDINKLKNHDPDILEQNSTVEQKNTASDFIFVGPSQNSKPSKSDLVRILKNPPSKKVDLMKPL